MVTLVPRDVITSDRIAPPVGPFSPAVRAGELLYLSGQVAQGPTTGKRVASLPLDAAIEIDVIAR